MNGNCCPACWAAALTCQPGYQDAPAPRDPGTRAIQAQRALRNGADTYRLYARPFERAPQPQPARAGSDHAEAGGGEHAAGNCGCRGQDVPGPQAAADHDGAAAAAAATPLASSDQPASGASAPCPVKRQK